MRIWLWLEVVDNFHSGFAQDVNSSARLTFDEQRCASRIRERELHTLKSLQNPREANC
jgi:hypothetical protein